MTYPTMDAPPLVAGALQVRVFWRYPAVHSGLSGALGSSYPAPMPGPSFQRNPSSLDGSLSVPSKHPGVVGNSDFVIPPV